MRAVHFDQELRCIDIAAPSLTGDETLIRLLKAGICNTDLEITRGYFGFRGVLGHEFVGIVEASKNSSLVGKRVVGEINAACGRCEYCRKHLQRHCPNRTVLGILNRDGAFREFLTLPEENLHLVADSISDEEAVFTEPIAAACEILDQIQIIPSDRVAILGDGKLGLLIAMVLSHSGCDLNLVGRHHAKLKLAEGYGVKCLGPEVTPKPRDFDIVIEATGSPSGWEQALQLIKPRGRLVLKSTFHGQVAFNPAPLVVDEITVIGSRCGRFEPALSLLKAKNVQPMRLVHHTLPLARALQAFDLARQPEVLKVLLQP
jgi:threonine dehydrogenase-like Zn-dependent dehydrogenase